MKNFHSGSYVKQSGGYKSFSPTLVHRLWSIDDPRTIRLLGRANRLLGALEVYTSTIPDVESFLQLYTTQEAAASSKIEGTQTSIDEALLPSEQIAPEAWADWQEVVNYRKALEFAVKRIQELPLSSRLIREVHQILMDSVRGQHKQPGEFRRSQNWIGGATVQSARFIPPAHTEIAHLMSDIEQLIHDENNLTPILIKAAILHYQFETIHPFLDGNGRTGRVLIVLYLMQEQLLSYPIFPISDFLERLRPTYYELLDRVRTHNEMKRWVTFFLEGTIEVCEQTLESLKGIVALREEIRQEVIPTFGARAANAQQLIQSLYHQPIVSIEQVATIIGKTYPTANKLVMELVEKKVLVPSSEKSRYRRLFTFRRYLDLFQTPITP